jgi:hypothetical protein
LATNLPYLATIEQERGQPRGVPDSLTTFVDRLDEMRRVSKGGLDMRYDLSQNGEESFGERREIPIGSSTILKFNSEGRTQSPSEPLGKQPDSRFAQSPSVRERNGREPRGEGSSKYPEIPLLDDTTITISVIEGRSKGLTYRMKKLCITAGRVGGGADFEFDEPAASDVHCFVAARPDSVRLYAAPSVGIHVNDQPIRTVELTDTSTFRVGSSLLRVSILPSQRADVRTRKSAEK